MYKIAIFEDEPLILNSLCNNIHWEELGCQIAAKSDGTDAYRLIEETLPDIVITDIRMDTADGLEICSWLHHKYPQIKKIIITGYGTIEYAKDAFKSEVTDFILKPIDRTELLKVVQKVTNEIQERELLSQNIFSLNQTLTNYKSQLIEKFLADLADGQECSGESLFQRTRELDITLDNYFCLTVDVYTSVRRPSDQQDIISVLNYELQYGTLLDHFPCRYYCFFCQRYYCICEITDSPSLKQSALVYRQIQEDVFALQERLIKVFQFPLYLCYSDIYQYPHEFYQCFQQINNLIERKFFVSQNNILSWNTIDEQHKQLDKIKIQEWSEHAISDIIIGNHEQAFLTLEQLWNLLSGLSEEDAKYKCLEFFVSFKKLCEPYHIMTESVLTTDMLIKIFHTECSFQNIKKAYFYPLLQSCLEQRMEKINKRNSISRQVTDFIWQSIDSTITVTAIAEHFNYNSKYLSMIVKKECGQTIIDIITDVRIEKAKELLLSTNEKTYVIAEKVGIHDAKYFSQIFQKKTGMTPREYRRHPLRI